jgi:hypothetical protein
MGPTTGGDNDEAELRRDERSLVQRISRALRFADLMAVMMVGATAMSAFATWRMASLTQTLFAVTERPYVGVARVSFEPGRDNTTRVRLDFRNFSHVYATDGVARIWIMIDGKRLRHHEGAARTMNVGMISPTVPHFLYRSLPTAVYDSIINGQAKIVVRGKIIYRGPDQREFCYNEYFTYDDQADGFVSAGGDDRCGGVIY